MEPHHPRVEHRSRSESRKRLLWNVKGPVKENCTGKGYFVRLHLSELGFYSCPPLPYPFHKCKGQRALGGVGESLHWAQLVFSHLNFMLLFPLHIYYHLRFIYIPSLSTVIRATPPKLASFASFINMLFTLPFSDH